MEILERFYSYRSDSETVVIGDRFTNWAACICTEGEDCPTPAQARADLIVKLLNEAGAKGQYPTAAADDPPQ